MCAGQWRRPCVGGGRHTANCTAMACAYSSEVQCMPVSRLSRKSHEYLMRNNHQRIHLPRSSYTLCAAFKVVQLGSRLGWWYIVLQPPHHASTLEATSQYLYVSVEQSQKKGLAKAELLPLPPPLLLLLLSNVAHRVRKTKFDRIHEQ